MRFRGGIAAVPLGFVTQNADNFIRRLDNGRLTAARYTSL